MRRGNARQFSCYLDGHAGRGILAAAGRTAVTDEPAPPDAEKPHGERQRLVELAPGSRALQVDCCAHGARMARIDGRRRVAITSDDDWGRE